jgi:hypothetical protein
VRATKARQKRAGSKAKPTSQPASRSAVSGTLSSERCLRLLLTLSISWIGGIQQRIKKNFMVRQQHHRDGNRGNDFNLTTCTHATPVATGESCFTDG